MENITEFIRQLNGIVSGPILLPLLAGAGLFLTIGLRLTTLRRIPYAFRMLWDGRKKTDQTGDISPFNALMTAMSATVGTGNIAGVATAIFFGAPAPSSGCGSSPCWEWEPLLRRRRSPSGSAKKTRSAT